MTIAVPLPQVCLYIVLCYETTREIWHTIRLILALFLYSVSILLHSDDFPWRVSDEKLWEEKSFTSSNVSLFLAMQRS